ncbi:MULTISPECIES: PHP-associated domain-containing protein [Desulfosediminicola]|uniref:PHP-associated domain-containing protein n=1 Tax=Desulfosediminicola TaxID=2886823 RepID=UPI0010AB6CAF|nr:PHP-associated domain-containing protein [Desulfosediminicola ganghwensis]
MTANKDNHCFSIDMHVHTSRYSECAESLDPRQIDSYAMRAGLHAVVITEHNTMWGNNEIKELQAQMSSILLFNGIEVTTNGGHHLVILGVDENTPLPKGISCSDAISTAHEQGGVAILAHPYRNGLPPLHTIEMVDAVEIASTSLSRKETDLSCHLAQFLGKQAIGCSDAHALTRIGWSYTQFPCSPRDTSHLCQMIRQGLGNPVMPKRCFN